MQGYGVVEHLPALPVRHIVVEVDRVPIVVSHRRASASVPGASNSLHSRFILTPSGEGVVASQDQEALEVVALSPGKSVLAMYRDGPTVVYPVRSYLSSELYEAE